MEPYDQWLAGCRYIKSLLFISLAIGNNLFFMLHYLYTYPETIVDGDGIRFSIYLSGCRHHCRGCHNPESWNPASGHPLTREKIEEFIEAINSNPLLDGITFSGGDPFYSPEDFLPLIKEFSERTGQNIWCYTGYTYEELLEDPVRRVRRVGVKNTPRRVSSTPQHRAKAMSVCTAERTFS